MKTGLSRASVYKYMALGLFPRQHMLRAAIWLMVLGSHWAHLYELAPSPH